MLLAQLFQELGGGPGASCLYILVASANGGHGLFISLLIRRQEFSQNLIHAPRVRATQARVKHGLRVEVQWSLFGRFGGNGISMKAWLPGVAALTLAFIAVP
jgi:hypothetical protein